MPPLKIEHASARQTRTVLRHTLATGVQTSAELERHVNGFLRYAREMGLDLSRQWLCTDGGQVATACNCVESPGRTAILCLPHSRVGPVDAIRRTPPSTR